MEFHEKLQQLRKQKGLTQEELAERLYVSRTAVSKWESGRGFPNIESLKAISKCFAISVDELLSGEEILAIAEKDQEENEEVIRDIMFGLLDCGMVLLLFLPFFGQECNGTIQAVSLLTITALPLYLKVIYLVDVLATNLWGVLSLTLQNCRQTLWLKNKRMASIALSVASVFLFIISQQPYAAVFAFAFLMIKVFMLIKRH